jgi:putative Holliday junction resolvase
LYKSNPIPTSLNHSGKILGIDYGEKRCGLALTDSAQIVAAPLKTVETRFIMDELKTLVAKENIRTIVVGEARYLNGDASATTALQQAFCTRLTQVFPQVILARIDEMYTSKLAQQSLIMSGMRKKARQDKSQLDMVSAAILLQSYLDQRPQ